jgi:allophanate hydrolase
MPATFKFGVPKPEQCQFFGNRETEALFKASIEQLTKLGGTAIEIDFSPFLSAARLLYEGAWVAERTLSTEKMMTEQPEALLPVIRQIVTQGHKFSALDAFSGFYQMQTFKRKAEAELAKVDVLVTPTAGTIYTISELEANPIALNSNLGYYTNYMNLFDLCSLAAPAGFQSNDLPFGITFVAPAFHDHALLVLAKRYQSAIAKTLGATDVAYAAEPASTNVAPGRIRVAVCGAHMSGLPLNHQLTDRGAILIEATTTSPEYRFYALPDGKRPGLIKAQPGAALALEVWEMDEQYFGSFVNGIPAPLGIGRVTLASGENVAGFLCESEAIAGSRDITEFGSWRTWKASS